MPKIKRRLRRLPPTANAGKHSLDTWPDSSTTLPCGAGVSRYSRGVVRHVILEALERSRKRSATRAAAAATEAVRRRNHADMKAGRAPAHCAKRRRQVARENARASARGTIAALRAMTSGKDHWLDVHTRRYIGAVLQGRVSLLPCASEHKSGPDAPTEYVVRAAIAELADPDRYEHSPIHARAGSRRIAEPMRIVWGDPPSYAVPDLTSYDTVAYAYGEAPPASTPPRRPRVWRQHQHAMLAGDCTALLRGAIRGVAGNPPAPKAVAAELDRAAAGPSKDGPVQHPPGYDELLIQARQYMARMLRGSASVSMAGVPEPSQAAVGAPKAVLRHARAAVLGLVHAGQVRAHLRLGKPPALQRVRVVPERPPPDADRRASASTGVVYCY